MYSSDLARLNLRYLFLMIDFWYSSQDLGMAILDRYLYLSLGQAEPLSLLQHRQRQRQSQRQSQRGRGHQHMKVSAPRGRDAGALAVAAWPAHSSGQSVSVEAGS